MLESTFQKKVTKVFDSWIKEGEPLYFFVKEAGAIRGIPDIVGCYNGHFFAWELKRNLAEASKTSGRIALQLYNVSRIHRAQGVAEVVHPENLEQKLLELRARCSPIPTAPSSAALGKELGTAALAHQ